MPTRRTTDPIPGLTALLWPSPWEDLVGLVQHDAALLDACQKQFPKSAIPLALHEFTPDWVREGAHDVLCTIGHLDTVRRWTEGETPGAIIAIDRMTSDLLIYLGLPETRTLACTALVILFIKGLHDEGPAAPDRTS